MLFSKFLNCCCFSIIFFDQIVVIQVELDSFGKLKLDSRVYVIKMICNLNSEGNEKCGLFSKGPTTFKN